MRSILVYFTFWLVMDGRYIVGYLVLYDLFY